MCEVVSVPEYKQSKKRWQCMVKLLPDLWDQERNELCFVLAQKQASLDANKLTLLPMAQLSRDNLQLRETIRSLREELARAEHALAAQKALLNSAKVREWELREELMSKINNRR